MTISDQTASESYVANGVSKNFAFNHPFLTEDELLVTYRPASTGVEATWTLGVDYTLSGTPDASGNYKDGATVVATLLPASEDVVVIDRNSDLTQTADYTFADKFPAAQHEGALDKATMVTQELQTKISRSVRRSQFTNEDFNLVLPAALSDAGSAGKVIKVNATSDGFVLSDNDPDEVVDEAQAAVTEAEAAQAAAEAAQAGAEAAQAAAETAETNAETAQAGAEAAQAAAETAETNAETAQAAAELARDEAEAAVATINPPDPTGHGGEYFRQKGDESGFEYRTNAETFNDIKQAATDAATGVVEKATLAEMVAGTADKFPDALTVKAAQGLTLLATMTASGSSTIAFTSGLDDTYDTYLIDITNLKASSAGALLRAQLSTNGGSSYISSAGAYVYSNGGTASGGTFSGENTTATYLGISATGFGFQTGFPGTAQIWLSNPEVNEITNLDWKVNTPNSTAAATLRTNGGGSTVAAGIHNAIQFLMSTGNIATGTFRLYGLRK